MCAYTLTMPICYNSEVPQNGAGMYPSRDITFNYRVSYARVKRTITLCIAHMARFTKDKGWRVIAFLRVPIAMDVAMDILPLENFFWGQIV